MASLARLVPAAPAAAPAAPATVVPAAPAAPVARRRTALDTAVARGNATLVRSLLDRGASVGSVTDSGGLASLYRTAATPAAREIVRLLAQRAWVTAINWRGAGGRTALMLAAMAGDRSLADLLIAGGADLRLADSAGKTAAQLAAEAGQPVLARHLDALAAFGSVPATAMIAAARADSVERVTAMLALLPALANARDASGSNALSATLASGGRERMVEMLLAAGADVRARDTAGRTALHNASYAGQAAVALLLARGAPVEDRDASGATPLMHAVRAGCPAGFIRQLIAAGASLATRAERGTILSYAVQSNSGAACVTLLLEQGANPNAPVGRGDRTALWCAASGAGWNRAVPVVTALLAGGADPRFADSTGSTPLHGANAAAGVLLLDRGADPKRHVSRGHATAYRGGARRYRRGAAAAVTRRQCGSATVPAARRSTSSGNRSPASGLPHRRRRTG